MTPNPSHFEIRVDGGGWQRLEGPLRWSLHAGDNELAVRGVNLFGRAGRVSRARVAYRG